MQDRNSNEINGWDEIAAHLGTSRRTAQIYESELRMPVHRLPGKKSRVWAYRDELDDWKKLAASGPNEAQAKSAPGEPVTDSFASAGSVALIEDPRPNVPGGKTQLGDSPLSGSRRKRGLAGAALVVAIAVTCALTLGSDPRLVGIRVEGRTLIAMDRNGQEIWRHLFPWEMNGAAYTGAEGHNYFWIGQLGGDRENSLVLVARPWKIEESGTPVYCFGPGGKVKWQFRAGRAVTDGSGTTMVPPFYTGALYVLSGKTPGQQRIVVSSVHYLNAPNQIAILDSEGRTAAEYWHPGHLLHLAEARLAESDHPLLLLAGVSNANHQAALVALDPAGMTGIQTPVEVSDRRSGLANMSPAREAATVFFPRSVLSEGQPYTRARNLSVTQDRIVVQVAENTNENSQVGFIYELDFALRVVAVTSMNGVEAVEAYRSIHEKKLGIARDLDVEAECKRLKSSVVVSRRF